MLAVLSPAKSLDFESKAPTRKTSQPRLADEASGIIEVMRGKSPDEIADLMHLSPELAELNAQRYADYQDQPSRKTVKQAVLAFNGDVYQGISAATRFDERDFTEAQKTIRILSGLYGLLRPLDLIQPYRLEMGTRLATDRGATLYQWWGPRITDLLAADLAASPGSDTLVNLASQEYFGAVQGDRLDARIVTPRFEDQTPAGDFKVVSFFAKRARGEMAAWMVQHRVRSPRALRDFDGAGYAYDAASSSPDQPVFRRGRSRVMAG